MTLPQPVPAVCNKDCELCGLSYVATGHTVWPANCPHGSETLLTNEVLDRIIERWT